MSSVTKEERFRELRPAFQNLELMSVHPKNSAELDKSLTIVKGEAGFSFLRYYSDLETSQNLRVEGNRK